MELRKAMFAGSWYPSHAAECEAMIQQFLKDPSMDRMPGIKAYAGIVPHAGWFFSGAIACNVISTLSQAGPGDCLIIFGMHLHPSSPNFIMTDGAWETPFGALPIDPEVAHLLTREFPFQVERGGAFTPDNTIELQLPFIKYFFPDARIVPIGVSPNPEAPNIGKAAVRLAMESGRRLRVVGSTDLTHYGDNYGFTPKGTGPEALKWVTTKNDPEIIQALLHKTPDKVLEVARTRENACCAGAAAAALAAANAMGATQGHRMAYATSYDKSPGRSFVGYVGIVYHRPS